MGYYVVEFVDVLTAAGVECRVTSVNAGWETRARSSGGFPEVPLGLVIHHTASNTTPENDLSWQINGCQDAPVGNMLLDRDGIVWPVAAGASNCAGKGGPWTFSRGTVPLDSGNTRCWNIEAASDGVGGRWPVAQIDSYFKCMNALSAHFGNQPGDVVTHNGWAPTRKIDPATADAVEGPWRPSSCTSSGTWLLDDIRDECERRAIAPPEEIDMTDDQARQLQELYQAMCSPQPGFVDPQGNVLNAAWAALYAETLIAGDIYRMLADVQQRVKNLEG